MTENEKTLAAEPDRIPDGTWQLPVLAAFVVAACRRSGEDAWMIGKAVLVARDKHKQERDWLRWLREDVRVLARSTAYRYIDICLNFTLEEARTTPRNVLYRLLYGKGDDSEKTGQRPEGWREPSPTTGRSGRSPKDSTGPRARRATRHLPSTPSTMLRKRLPRPRRPSRPPRSTR